MDSPRPSLAAISITLAGVALMAAIVLAVPELREATAAAVRGDTEQVREPIDDLGVAGPLLIIALTLLHSVVFYPAEIVDAAAGFVYGFWAALAMVMVGWVLSGTLCFAAGRSLARPLLGRWLGADRFERVGRMIERGGVPLLLGVRLIPVFPFSIISYAAGAAGVPPWRFVWTTAVGFVPITAASVYLGTRLETLHLTDPALLGALALVVALLVGGHWILRRGHRGRGDQDATDP